MGRGAHGPARRRRAGRRVLPPWRRPERFREGLLGPCGFPPLVGAPWSDCVTVFVFGAGSSQRGCRYRGWYPQIQLEGFVCGVQRPRFVHPVQLAWFHSWASDSYVAPQFAHFCSIVVCCCDICPHLKNNR